MVSNSVKPCNGNTGLKKVISIWIHVLIVREIILATLDGQSTHGPSRWVRPERLVRSSEVVSRTVKKHSDSKVYIVVYRI